jgi:mannosyl-3-phosphoglycerate phosphatase
MDTELTERPRSHLIVFTDLDGTLLDGSDGSFDKAVPALRLLAERGIPLVPCTSKTRSEVEFYRDRLNNCDPFVVENGGAVYIPRDYFAFPFSHDRATADYFVLELGAPYDTSVKALADLKSRTGVSLRGFSDMTVQEVASRCGVSLQLAAMAKQREYDEPFLILEPEAASAVIDAADIPITQGDRFYHIAASDKGGAVCSLMELFKRSHPDASSVGIGDTLNDLPLLRAVDIPILVGADDAAYDRRVAAPRLRYAEGAGPEGWNSAVTNIVDRASTAVKR